MERKTPPEARAIERLQSAFREHNLTLYLGAGASVGSGVPTWSDLVLIVYLNSLRFQSNEASSWSLLGATAQWRFGQDRAPLEIATRQLRKSFKNSTEFLQWVRFALYSAFEFDSRGKPTQQAHALIRHNATLMAIVDLCRRSEPGRSGVRAVVTYNLDGLLELALGAQRHQTLWKQARRKPETLPIYHVHGYLPVRDPLQEYGERIGSSADEIVLTEDQYHREAGDPYSWGNLVQLQAMSNSVGLTIGLSLSDPNIRRILDAAARAPSKPEIYALLQRPEPPDPGESDLEAIARLSELPAPFEGTTPEEPAVESDAWRNGVRRFVRRLEDLNIRRQTSVLRDLGVEPIWCRHEEIQSIVNRVIGRTARARKADGR